MIETKRDMRPEQMMDFIGFDYPTILEIGCNDGADTNRLLDLFSGAIIWCFEPDPRAIKRYRQTVFNPRAVLAEVAISDKDGTATFYGSSGRPPERSRHPGASHYCYLDEWDLSGSLCKPTGHLQFSPWTTFPKDRQYQVKTVRLDTWLNDCPEVCLSSDRKDGVIDFIWVDVQGAEALLIAGAPTVLSRTRYFYTEFYDKPLYEGQLPLTELRKMLPEFDLMGIYGDNALFGNRNLR